MKIILCLGALLCMMSCKRYTCNCTTTGSQGLSDDAYQVSARDKDEALSKCRDKHDKTAIGTKKAYCVIK
jgi:hypothetical protein